MKKFKLTDGTLRNIENRLRKVLKNEFPSSDGMWLEVQNVDIDLAEGEYDITLKVGYGREDKTVGESWSGQIDIFLVDGNLDFIAGQFTQALITN